LPVIHSVGCAKIIFFADLQNISGFFLAQFHQYPIGGFRMEKNNQLIIGTFFRFFGNEDKPTCLQPFDFSRNVFHAKGNMMDALPSFFNKFGNGAVLTACFEQFNFAVAALPFPVCKALFPEGG